MFLKEKKKNVSIFEKEWFRWAFSNLHVHLLGDIWDRLQPIISPHSTGTKLGLSGTSEQRLFMWCFLSKGDHSFSYQMVNPTFVGQKNDLIRNCMFSCQNMMLVTFCLESVSQLIFLKNTCCFTWHILILMISIGLSYENEKQTSYFFNIKLNIQKQPKTKL